MKQKIEISEIEVKELINNTRNLPDSERPVFLYMKRHNITGLLYFGRTIQQPYTYVGSGSSWLNHLKENGKDISTIWLRKFENCDDIRLEKMARRISKQLDIVKSDKFANNIPEIGHNKSRKLPSQEYLHECFYYDEETGMLTWKERPLHHFKTEGLWRMWNSQFAGKKITYNNNRYYIVVLDMIHYMVHRIVWKLKKGIEPKECIDHIDGDGMNNTIDNLRQASKAENGRNTKLSKNNKTGAKGVFRVSDSTYLAKITFDGVTHRLGLFDTVEAASDAYQKASFDLHGEFSNVTNTEYQEKLKNVKMAMDKLKGIDMIDDIYYVKIEYNGVGHNLGSFNTENVARKQYEKGLMILEKHPKITSDEFAEKIKMLKKDTEPKKGYYFQKSSNKYAVSCYFKGNRIYLGAFDTSDEASNRYQEALKIYQEFPNMEEEDFLHRLNITKTIIKGYYYNKNRNNFVVDISYNVKKYHLGSYLTEDEAATIYKKAKSLLSDYLQSLDNIPPSHEYLKLMFLDLKNNFKQSLQSS